MESGKACMQKLLVTIKMKLLYKTQLVTMPTNDTTRCRMPDHCAPQAQAQGCSAMQLF